MAFVLPVLLNLSVAMGAYLAGTPPQPTPPKERQKVADYNVIHTICLSVYKVSDPYDSRNEANLALFFPSTPAGRTP